LPLRQRQEVQAVLRQPGKAELKTIAAALLDGCLIKSPFTGLLYFGVSLMAQAWLVKFQI
jgi:hypothetical protein